MSLNLFKYIGLGILGLGGACSVAALSSSKVRKFVGLSSESRRSFSSISSTTDSSEHLSIPYSDVSQSELDRQGQFLHELSKKVFKFLKDKKKGGADQKENVVKGLKDKFNGSLENEEDKGENFKSLCEAQKQKETGVGSDVTNEYSRLCFLDKSVENEHNFRIKGLLFNGGLNLCYSEFYLGTKSNFELGTKFQTLHSDSNPIDVFNDGLNTNPERIKDFLDEKKLLNSSSRMPTCESLRSKD